MMANYERSLKTQEWKFLRDTLLLIKATILTDMLSTRFTNLDMSEKDVEQRAYFNIMEVIDFLLSPDRWIKMKKARFSALANFRGKVKPNQEKEKQHGR